MRAFFCACEIERDANVFTHIFCWQNNLIERKHIMNNGKIASKPNSKPNLTIEVNFQLDFIFLSDNTIQYPIFFASYLTCKRDAKMC